MTRARILADYVSSGDELALKAPLASPDFTGTVDLTGTTVSLDDDEISLDKVNGGTLGTGTIGGSSVVNTSGTITTIGSGARLDISKAITGANDQELLKIERTGGSTSDGARQASISFADGNNSTYVGKISGYRDAPSGNFNGGLRFYVNPHDVNSSATFAELNGTPALHLNSDQNVVIPTGNLVIGTAGKGIDFGVTSVHGTSNTAEILNDYEQGHWTPTGLGSGGVVNGALDSLYVKIGNLVTVWFDITFGSGAGNNFTGLPYTVEGGDVAGGMIGYGSGGGAVGLLSSSSQTSITFYNGTTAWDPGSDRQIGSFTYRTTQN
jgi:hypothetical protein